MAIFGKACQLVALMLLPLSMLLELTGGLGRKFGISDMLVMLVFGFCLFYVGRFLEGYAKA